MSGKQSASTTPTETATGVLRPEDVPRHDLPVVMRGYDREKVDQYLERIADAYLLRWRQTVALRERLGTLEEELEAAQDDVQESARSVVELIQCCATATDQLTQASEARDELHATLAVSERERKEALAELREVSEKASDLERRLKKLGSGRQSREAAAAAQPALTDGEAASLLLAAARAAEDVRAASRERALRTLTKARERAMQLHAAGEQVCAALAEPEERRDLADEKAKLERAALAETQERRRLAELEADEVLVGARAEAGRAVTAIEEERARVRGLLTGALASLDAQGTPVGGDGEGEPASAETLVAELSSHLQGSTAPAA